MQNTDNTAKPKSIFREPWGWFVLSPLIAVVLVSSVTVTIAVTGADDVVSDNYYREGRMINHDFGAEENARIAGIGGHLSFDKSSREVRFEIRNADEFPFGAVKLYLSHPSDADKDVIFNLRPLATDYYLSTLDRELGGRWYIRLSAYESEESSTEVWRLNGEINFATADHLVFN